MARKSSGPHDGDRSAQPVEGEPTVEQDLGHHGAGKTDAEGTTRPVAGSSSPETVPGNRGEDATGPANRAETRSGQSSVTDLTKNTEGSQAGEHNAGEHNAGEHNADGEASPAGDVSADSPQTDAATTDPGPTKPAQPDSATQTTAQSEPDPNRPVTRAELRARREAEAAARAASGEAQTPAEEPAEEPEPEEEPSHAAIDAMAEVAETLQDEGYCVVVAARWPGARNAWVELLLVGTSGVFVLATNNWRGVRLVDGKVLANSLDVERAARSLTTVSNKVEAELVTIGVAPGEIVPVAITEALAVGPQLGNHGRIRVVDPEGLMPLIRARGRRFKQSHVDRIAAQLADIFPEQLADAVAAAASEEAPDPAAEVTEVEPWMTFLNPDQAQLAHREWNGPARIRGAAGTGKTVVGMHRAAYLALTTPDRVMVASLVRTLPKVMERNFALLSPETRHKVDFTSVHRVALEVLNHRGVRINIDLGAAALAFRAAWDKVGARSILADQPVPVTYWQEEIDHVIKGRGVSTLERYLVMDRVGRRYPAKAQLRAQVWSLLNAYQAELATRDVIDLADMLVLADAELARQPWHVAYSAVIVDEAQDLSPVGIRMLHRLVGDRPNGLLLIADGQQGVTPGGFHLSEAQVSVTGRDALLQRNMRSDERLGHVAHQVVSTSTFDDLDGFVWHPDRDLTWAREGGHEPTIVQAASVKAHDDALLAWVGEVMNREGDDVPDLAVLSARHTQVGHYRELLLSHGYDVIDLDGFDGSQRAIKIGTMRRAKGLTFANVALTQLFGDSLQNTTLTNPATGTGVAASLERAEREQREVFSAVSRVTHELWMGYVTGA